MSQPMLSRVEMSELLWQVVEDEIRRLEEVAMLAYGYDYVQPREPPEDWLPQGDPENTIQAGHQEHTGKERC